MNRRSPLPLLPWLAPVILLAVGSARETATPAAAPAEPGERVPANLALVPWPHEVKPGTGTMRLGEGSRVVAGDEKLLPLARILADEIFLTRGLRLPAVRAAARDGDISLEMDDGLKG